MERLERTLRQWWHRLEERDTMTAYAHGDEWPRLLPRGEHPDCSPNRSEFLSFHHSQRNPRPERAPWVRWFRSWPCGCRPNLALNRTEAVCNPSQAQHLTSTSAKSTGAGWSCALSRRLDEE